MDEPRLRLAGALIGLARSTEGNEFLIDGDTLSVFSRCLRALRSPMDTGSLKDLLPGIERERIKLAPGCHTCVSKCGRTDAFDMTMLGEEEPRIRELKFRMLELAANAAAKSPLAPPLSDAVIKALIMIGIEGYAPKTLETVAAELQNMM